MEMTSNVMRKAMSYGSVVIERMNDIKCFAEHKADFDWCDFAKNNFGLECIDAILKSTMVRENCSGLDDKDADYYVAYTNLNNELFKSVDDLFYDHQSNISAIVNEIDCDGSYLLYYDGYLFGVVWDEREEQKYNKAIYSASYCVGYKAKTYINHLTEVYGDAFVMYFKETFKDSGVIFDSSNKVAEDIGVIVDADLLHGFDTLEWDFLLDAVSKSGDNTIYTTIDGLRKAYKKTTAYHIVKTIDGEVFNEIVCNGKDDALDKLESIVRKYLNVLSAYCDKDESHDIHLGCDEFRIDNVSYKIVKK